MSPSLIISMIAVVISAIAIGVSIWTHNRNHKLQARIVALEEAREKDRLAEKNKANLTAKITKEELRRSSTHRISWQYHLVVENKGLGQARSIDLRLDGMTVHEHHCVVKPVEEKGFLGPSSSFRYLLAFSSNAPHPSRVDITWRDDSDDEGVYRSPLTV